MVSFSSHKRRQLTQIPDAASSLPPSLCLLLSLSLSQALKIKVTIVKWQQKASSCK